MSAGEDGPPPRRTSERGGGIERLAAELPDWGGGMSQRGGEKGLILGKHAKMLRHLPSDLEAAVIWGVKIALYRYLVPYVDNRAQGEGTVDPHWRKRKRRGKRKRPHLLNTNGFRGG